MHGLTSDFIPASGLDAMAEAQKYSGDSAKTHLEVAAAFARLHGYFLAHQKGRDIITNDDLSSIDFASYSGLTFSLKVKDSKLPHAITQFLELKLVKAFNEYSKTFDLTATVPDDHPLKFLGVNFVSVRGYMPDTCKLVETRVPLSETELAYHQDILAQGKVQYKTDCGLEADLDAPVEAASVSVD
jgi:hypothetical protein